MPVRIVDLPVFGSLTIVNSISNTLPNGAGTRSEAVFADPFRSDTD